MEGLMSAIGGRRAEDATAKALAISPLCADAYVLVAEEEAKSAEEALEYYCKGVEAGEQALGTKRFKQYAGHFWGFIETRTCAHERVWPLSSTCSARLMPRSATIKKCRC
jgi:hypothetical protein